MNRHSSRRRLRLVRALAGIIAVAFVFGPGVAGVLGAREKPIENRALAPAPRVDDGFGAADAVTPWAIDRLPGRSKAIELKGLLDYYGYGDLPGTQVVQPVGAAGAGGAQPGPSRNDGASLRPKVVRGKDGYLFYGLDFTSACRGASRFQGAVEGVRDLARIVARSGRKVVFTVVPNKSSVVTDALPRAVPRGSCAKDGISREIDVLDDFSDPLWVPLRAELAALDRSGKDAYWRTDTHWTTLGASVWVNALVERLDPDLASRPTFDPARETLVGDLTSLLGLRFAETPDSVRTATDATVTDTRLPGFDPAKGEQQTSAWTTSPDTGIIAGRTVFVGDSFTRRMLPLVRPLVADGTFAWIGSTPDDEVVTHIAAADTVVIEVVQRNLLTGESLLTKKSFQRKVARALGVTP